ncbi:outer membrane protein assembly factor BamB family protein [Galbibacter mesophilus]|uniref:outer membrane protein assembly factor BamB family protein n=1 Tax=Galbibacter mesophilus TaxID=379069 RepID=UPI00191D298E|nr:PQQ-binding-like beta-propeller repeat protein [Galbibacter mesophilus]MCM5663874.1 PQQ-binding-like beta-propeller repeat protein [Galbibacter mesophilus]
MKDLLKKLRVISSVIIVVLLFSCASEEKEKTEIEVETGLMELDSLRNELLNDIPTDSTNFAKRVNGLKLWVRHLSYAGADLNPLRAYYTEHIQNGKTPDNFPAIDSMYRGLEKIEVAFGKNPNRHLIKMEREADSNFVTEDWFTLRGDLGQTGFTEQPGPQKGTLKWRFAAGHSWYSKPAFSNGKVYMASPGVSYEAYCLDAETGAYLWKTHQKENQNQYKTPRNVSPAIIAGNHLIVREIGSGGNKGAAKDFVYINKDTGIEEKEVFAGHVDYRAGYGAFDGNSEFLVFPHSLQEIGAGQTGGEVKTVSFDSLVCVSTQSGERLWKHYMGEFYSEPLLVNNSVYAGNFQGDFKSIDAKSGEVNFTIETKAPINSKASVQGKNVFFGNENGSVFSVETKKGEILWEQKLPTEEKAFQQFSRIVSHEGKLYVGSATKKVFCLAEDTGKLLWEIETDDWVRSAPVISEGKLIAATVKGTVYGIDLSIENPKIAWKSNISNHGVYADLSVYENGVFVPSSDFYLHKLNPENGEVLWKQSIFESTTNQDGERVLADLVGGGPDYQAGTTVVDGIAYFGSPRFVYAVDVKTGEEVWKFETRGQICGAPAVANGKVFFGQQGGTDKFYCVDAKSGKLIWKKPYQWTWASPNVDDTNVYFATVQGDFYACNQQTGEVLWKYESKEGAYPAPSIDGDKVFFGSWNGNYYAFNKNTGELIWNADIAGHPDSGSTIVSNNQFYGQGFLSKYLYTLNATTGEELWKYPLDGEWCNASPVSDGEFVLYSTYLPWLHQAPFPSHTTCLNAKTGEKVYDIPFAGGLTGAVICQDLLFTASTTDTYMRAWDVATGNMRWQYRMGGRAEETCTSIYGDNAFILANDGYLYAFE